MILHYTILIIILFAGILLYFHIADKFNIIDKPNQRSSHNYITIRGGGIIFWLAGVLYGLQHLPDSMYFIIGLTLICGVSFWDDISSLPSRVRLMVHFVSISLVFYYMHIFQIVPWWAVIIAYVFFIGTLNAYNFMDGINGITSLYSLAVLLALQYVNIKVMAFTSTQGINYAIAACLVFLFFNYRKKAKCFAGDVGSMAIAFWVLTLLLQLMLRTDSMLWILFLAVYGVDSVCTIMHRLYLKQNIMEAHRLHFYQILANERGFSHRQISALYALLQAAICALLIYGYLHHWNTGILSICILIPLGLLYTLKFRKR